VPPPSARPRAAEPSVNAWADAQEPRPGPGARLWPELEDDVHGGLGDLPEPAEADVVGQLAYRLLWPRSRRQDRHKSLTQRRVANLGARSRVIWAAAKNPLARRVFVVAPPGERAGDPHQARCLAAQR
jgi:hypothetical protein